jgi:FlaA1/EpsC-like NDP-sugar epimerase
MNMNTKERLELICGFITGLLGIGVTAAALYETRESARLLRQAAPIVQTLVLWLILYILPSLLVAIGAYLQVVKKQSRGATMVIAGSCFITVIFLLSFVSLIVRKGALYSAPMLLLVYSRC